MRVPCFDKKVVKILFTCLLAINFLKGGVMNSVCVGEKMEVDLSNLSSGIYFLRGIGRQSEFSETILKL